jgi:hypothetical protein
LLRGHGFLLLRHLQSFALEGRLVSEVQRSAHAQRISKRQPAAAPAAVGGRGGAAGVWGRRGGGGGWYGRSSSSSSSGGAREKGHVNAKGVEASHLKRKQRETDAEREREDKRE